MDSGFTIIFNLGLNPFYHWRTQAHTDGKNTHQGRQQIQQIMAW